MPSLSSPLPSWHVLLDTPLPGESQVISRLQAQVDTCAEAIRQGHRQASDWVGLLRAKPFRHDSLEAFLQEYPLDSPAGNALMTLAEALLRIPDRRVAAQLVKDKLAAAQLDEHEGAGHSLLVSASSWGLRLTDRLLGAEQGDSRLGNWLADQTGSAVLKAAQAAMRLLSNRFVLAHDMESALKEARPWQKRGQWLSFDMLGEAALSRGDAIRYSRAYHEAISVIGQSFAPGTPDMPGISVKLSALCPRFEGLQEARVRQELGAALYDLAEHAVSSGVPLTVDAEESDRLELTVGLFEQVLRQPVIRASGTVGLAVQAYGTRALPVLEHLHALAESLDTRIPVRLVKGAYWDSEIRQAQLRGLSAYPVFTRKAATDLSYLACAHYLLQHPARFYPQFATHNACTIASLLALAPEGADMEFQRLHGMGEDLYHIVQSQHPALRCRLYAPVGEHRELLPYLVRRLLENGASSAFVQQAVNDTVSVESLCETPQTRLQQPARQPLPLPCALFGESRRNSPGMAWGFHAHRSALLAGLATWREAQWQSLEGTGRAHVSRSPWDPARHVGRWQDWPPEQVMHAMEDTRLAFPTWNGRTVEERALCLERMAGLLEAHRDELLVLLGREAGRSLPDVLDEWREAIDFCLYYASQAREQLPARTLAGPTGEHNALGLEGRGVFACISPWNFPLAIFVGQIAAALVTGNTVIAKPAEQTPLIAWRATELFYQAGIPLEVLRCVQGRGEDVGPVLLSHPALAGVAFTGSHATARLIARRLAERSGAIVPLLAETGGVNAMLVDSSALPEQVVQDVIRSAFNSAGQRCSSLRVLYLQKDIAEGCLSLLTHALQELNIGDPTRPDTDIGPLIDAAACQAVQDYLLRVEQRGDLLFRLPLPEGLPEGGHFVAPAIVRVTGVEDIPGEIFGPVLHVASFDFDEVEQVVDAINASGYGLTFCIHSRNDRWARQLAARVSAGNVYLNRNMVGAVVGVQPFGGRGLSGTGPKAGGPHYLLRFTHETSLSDNLAARGGNIGLLTGGE